MHGLLPEGGALLPRTDQLARLCHFSDQFQVVPLRFSTDLDVHNPNTPEWREDVGLVVTRLLSKVPPAHPRRASPAPVGASEGRGPRAPREGWGGVGGAALSPGDPVFRLSAQCSGDS